VAVGRHHVSAGPEVVACVDRELTRGESIVNTVLLICVRRGRERTLTAPRGIVPFHFLSIDHARQGLGHAGVPMCWSRLSKSEWCKQTIVEMPNLTALCERLGRAHLSSVIERRDRRQLGSCRRATFWWRVVDGQSQFDIPRVVRRPIGRWSLRSGCRGSWCACSTASRNKQFVRFRRFVGCVRYCAVRCVVRRGYPAPAFYWCEKELALTLRLNGLASFQGTTCMLP